MAEGHTTTTHKDPHAHPHHAMSLRSRVTGWALRGLGVLHIATWVVCDPLRSGELIALFPEEAQAPASPGMPGIHAVRLPGRSHASQARGAL